MEGQIRHCVFELLARVGVLVLGPCTVRDESLRVVSCSRLRLMAENKGPDKAALAIDASELERSGMPLLRTIAPEEGGHPG